MGPSNLANLEALPGLVRERQVYLRAHSPQPWDFTPDHRAQALWAALKQEGAEELSGLGELLERLSVALREDAATG